MTSQRTTGSGDNLDEIRLLGVGGVGRHGVLPEERRDGQTFLVDLVLGVDTRAAATSDELTATVDYAAVAAQVVALIEGEPVNLIETLAARIADSALTYDGVHTVDVTVHKPEAPVGVPFTDVQVTIRRPVVAPVPAPAAPPVDAAPVAAAASSAGANPAAVAAAAPAQPVPDSVASRRPAPDLDAPPEQPVPVVLALGGNVGDVRGTLRSAVADLQDADGLTVEEISPLARTAAVLQPDAVAQPDYLNAVVLATTTLAPRELLALTQDLENTYGRRREERWGERTLDVDIVVFGGVTSTDPELTLPHPRANERAFVLVPWAQADPDAFLPGLGGGPVATLAETAPDRSGVRWLALDWLEEPSSAARAPVAPVPQAAAEMPSDVPAAEPEPAHEQEEADESALDPAWDEPSAEDLGDLELLARGDKEEPQAQPQHEEPAQQDEPASDALGWVPEKPVEAPPLAPRWQPLRRDD
ncbi:2-amino-4-hydroxy-6-hydroxymethyldihydropteridine diphosphokinase [Ruania alba]|nr:2-amino-4-hydroxy-6-hydroxymethyldihydropteridine diphosphokinase [Ruania alba]